MAPRSELQVVFGHVVARLRKEAGLSQEELAHRAGLHRTYVSLLERGIKTPTLGAIEGLARALGRSAWELVKEAEGQSPP